MERNQSNDDGIERMQEHRERFLAHGEEDVLDASGEGIRGKVGQPST